MAIDLAKEKREIGLCTMAKLGVKIIRDKEAWGTCPCCGCFGLIGKRRLNTRYVEEESNWLLSCLTCHEEAISYYNDLWEEYYSMVR